MIDPLLLDERIHSTIFLSISWVVHDALKNITTIASAEPRLRALKSDGSFCDLAWDTDWHSVAHFIGRWRPQHFFGLARLCSPFSRSTPCRRAFLEILSRPGLSQDFL
jgi:hypothetical protein